MVLLRGPSSQRARTLVLAFAVALAPRIGLAQTASDKVAAEALFEQARALMAQQHFAEACGKFELSQRLDAGVGTLLYLADCYEQAGRSASAWATFKEAAAGAHAAGQADREALARSLADALTPKLSLLTVRVADGAVAPGLEVRRDGEVVPQGLWGVPVPVDPGPRHLEASAPGKKPWSIDWQVSGPGATEVVVPALADAPVAVAPPPAASPVSVGSAPVAGQPMQGAERPRDGGGGGGQRAIGWVVGGVGVVALGIGGVFALQAKSRDSEAASHCGPDGFCTAEGVRLGDQAQSAASIATYASLGGAAAVVGGLVLVLTAPSDARSTASRSIVVAARAVPSGGFLTASAPW